jgi:beta-lactamase regulating signal transducer with metallopeptidase domain/uncharacterized membrane protein YkoI
MTTLSQLLLTFLSNAGWQAALIAAAAAACAWLLRDASARYKHLLWVAALALSVGLPALTSLQLADKPVLNNPPPPAMIRQPAIGSSSLPTGSPLLTERAGSRIPIGGALALGLLALYGLFLAYRAIRLLAAWRETRAMVRGGATAELDERARAVIEQCQAALGVKRVMILCSATLRVPVTLRSREPLIILPESLLREAAPEVLTAAFAHELAHVRRRDYAFNLLYELLYLPLSFHPALALVRRRIKQTRELRCDELVTQRLLNAQTYARSLLQLASSVLPPCKRAETLTVGIMDANILEVRIMSLLRKRNSSRRRTQWLLAAACMLLTLPCAVAAAFAIHVDVAPQAASLIAEIPSTELLERQETPTLEAKRRELRERQEREERALKERALKEHANLDSQYREEMEQHEKREREERAKQQAELVRLARISMEQAIQTATNQQPGKVLECGLVGERWEAPGKLAKDGLIFYHVVIHSGEETNPTVTHIWVNAIDGSIMKTEKE